MARRLGLFAAFFAFFTAFQAQNASDSLPPLRPERLLEADILGRTALSKKTEVISATRTATEIDEQPFTMFVVTAEEIARNNFVTLADVLRIAPGIRVSQPGSAIEGETFLMRGLRGNGYAKILINDVPIKPSALGGLPIGAQLPIRQAERIEILYGPAAAIYGGDACAGVINIILKETERPLFNQADLSFGSFSFNSLDLFFGGKLGRDKNIFRFSVYGSSTVQDDRELYESETGNFVVSQYVLAPNDDSAWRLAQNYRPDNQDRQNPSSIPQFSNTPHESRLFGLNLTWRGIHFTYHRMLRRDHSSLGLNSLAVAYSNPQSLLGERIETFSVGARRQRPRGGIDYNLSVVRHRMENRSNFSFVRPVLSDAFMQTQGWRDSSLIQWYSFQNDLEFRYFENERYARSSSTDVRQEIRGTRRFGRGWQWDLGNVSSFQNTAPLTLFLPVPFDRNAVRSPQPIRQLSTISLSTNHYAQLIYQRPRFFGLIGGSANFEPSGENFSTRAAFRAKLNRWASVRGVFSEGYRMPSSFYRSNSLFLATKGQRAEPRAQEFGIEKVQSIELGGRFLLGGRRRAEVVFFANAAENLLTNGHFRLEKDEFGIEQGYLGWLGSGTMRVQGLQFSYGKKSEIEGAEFFGEKIWDKIAFSHRLDWVLSRANFEDSDFLGSRPSGAPGLPRSIVRWNWSLGFEKWEFVSRINRESGAPTAQGWWKNRWQRAESRDATPRFSTVDFSIRLFLSKNFKIYAESINLFDAGFYGLDATGSPDDLFLNPQTGRQIRLGIHYDMN